MALLLCNAFGQSAIIFRGTAMNESQIPIAGAKVSFRDIPTRNTTTDKSGQFSFYCSQFLKHK